MKKRHFAELTSLLGLFFSSQTSLAETVQVVFEEWPPYQFTENKLIKGTDVEIINEVGRRIGVEFKFQSLPWKRALSNVAEGKSDAIFSLSKNPERAATMIFPETPINYERKVIFTLKDSPLKIGAMSDLKGMKVGVPAGNVYGKEFDTSKDFERVPSPNQEVLFKMLLAKRHAMIAASDLVA